MPTLQTYELGNCFGGKTVNNTAKRDIPNALKEILEASVTTKIPVLSTGFTITPNINANATLMREGSTIFIYNSANVNISYTMYNLGAYYYQKNDDNYYYYLDYIKDSNIIAFGIRGDYYVKKVNLPVIFAKNANGNWKCILPSIDSKYGCTSDDFNNSYSSSNKSNLTNYNANAYAVSPYKPVTSFAHPSYTNPIRQLGVQDSAVKNVFTMCHNNNDGVGVSLVQMPDIYEGCLFNNLYLVLSGSISSGSVVNVGGEDYQILAAPNVIVGGNALACKL